MAPECLRRTQLSEVGWQSIPVMNKYCSYLFLNSHNDAVKSDGNNTHLNHQQDMQKTT